MSSSKLFESKQVEIFLAWGSVAYAAGFVTVLAHTARLGIPIIEILKPLYIWIGLPLAIVLFSIKWLWELVNTRVKYIRSKFEQAKGEMMDLESNSSDKEMNDLLDAFSEYT